ncbi:MAG: response regulator transcription factor [Verrucomicrobiales bacterium]|nr:response regulator transcription factor [Verrucomicrobiales bacterium]MCP5525890.1 response regulator transcription factor [Verrucomicrobiales bacterium]
MTSPTNGPSPRPLIRVVDDDVSLLTAVARMLRASGFAVRTFGSAAEFLAAPEPEKPGCVVADLQMPHMDGLQLQLALAQIEATLPVIFLTGQGDIPTAVQAMRRGAVDFLTKRAPRTQLLAAIERALEWNARERSDHARRSELRDRFGALSSREKEVLQHVVQGKLNKQIAADLRIHERTVKLHRTAITTKLRVPSVAELTQLWLESDLATGSGVPPGASKDPSSSEKPPPPPAGR